MLTWFKKAMGNAVAWLMQYFQSGKAAQDAKWALEHVHEATPVIAVVMDVATALVPTPGEVDNLVWAAAKAKYPRFWDGSLKTAEELKLYALGVATELFKAKFPNVDTTLARTAVQLAYNDYKALNGRVA